MDKWAGQNPRRFPHVNIPSYTNAPLKRAPRIRRRQVTKHGNSGVVKNDHYDADPPKTIYIASKIRFSCGSHIKNTFNEIILWQYTIYFLYHEYFMIAP